MAQTASGKTAQNIITGARYIVNDNKSTGKFASDPEMLQWVNDGRLAICAKGNGIQTSELIDLTASTANYTPTNDYIKIVGVHYIDASSVSKALLPGTINKVGIEYNSVEPTYWDEFDGQIWVYPDLSSVTTEKVRVFEITRPSSDLTLSGSIDTPGIFDLALTYFVAAQHHLKDRQYASHAQMMQKFQDEMTIARVELNDARNR